MKKENNKTNKKLFSATAMLALSAAMLGTATYAWFTMNKTVSVTGMEVKAHAEEGLLINEVADASSTTWDEQATGGAASAVAMRPASTIGLATWWHANSKLVSDEAGIDNLSGTVDLDNGNKYLDISPNNVSDNPIYAAGSGNTHAETHVYYKDASFGTSGSYQDGEGYYIKYIYYLKSSGDQDLTASDLKVQVKATKNSGSSDDLDPALRVGVTMPVSSSSSTTAGTLIFAPVTGADTSYAVTTAADGSSSTSVTPIVATTGSFSAYTTLNSSGTDITIPNVNTDGIPVYVYVWFEGEDTHCMSQNLTTALAAYDIDINFQDSDIY